MTAITTVAADSTDKAAGIRRQWLKRAGMLSFWFFFIKGVLWLAAPFVFYFAL